MRSDNLLAAYWTRVWSKPRCSCYLCKYEHRSWQLFACWLFGRWPSLRTLPSYVDSPKCKIDIRKISKNWLVENWLHLSYQSSGFYVILCKDCNIADLGHIDIRKPLPSSSKHFTRLNVTHRGHARLCSSHCGANKVPGKTKRAHLYFDLSWSKTRSLSST